MQSPKQNAHEQQKMKADIKSKIFASAFFVYTNFDIQCKELYKNYCNDIKITVL